MALTPEQRAELARVIEALHEKLVREVRDEVDRSREEPYAAVAGSVADRADEAAADLISDIENAEIARDIGEIRALETARARLASGEYGRCGDCECEIPFERLRVYPAASRCAACQHIHERTHAPASQAKL